VQVVVGWGGNGQLRDSIRELCEKIKTISVEKRHVVNRIVALSDRKRTAWTVEQFGLNSSDPFEVLSLNHEYRHLRVECLPMRSREPGKAAWHPVSAPYPSYGICSDRTRGYMKS
jgi:hypothetical protein